MDNFLTIKMKIVYLIICVSFVFKIGLLSQIKGFAFMDNLSEDFVAGDDVAIAEVPFSTQLSVCLWFYPTWLRRRKFICSNLFI